MDRETDSEAGDFLPDERPFQFSFAMPAMPTM
jgi:hypothetical protein